MPPTAIPDARRVQGRAADPQRVLRSVTELKIFPIIGLDPLLAGPFRRLHGSAIRRRSRSGRGRLPQWFRRFRVSSLTPLMSEFMCQKTIARTMTRRSHDCHLAVDARPSDANALTISTSLTPARTRLRRSPGRILLCDQPRKAELSTR